METFKTVEYSYPTSPNADRFGFRKGCYTVEVLEGCKPPKAIAAYATRKEAIQHAAKLPQPWCWLFTQLRRDWLVDVA